MKSNKLRAFSIVCSLNCLSPLYPVSLVYNLKIAETTKRQALEHDKQKNYTIAAVIGVQQWRKRRDGDHQQTNAGLGTIIHVPSPFYIRADFAVGHVSERVPLLDNKTFSRTQTDDILFSGGYSHKLGGKSRITVSGLLGIPTHKDSGFQSIQLGTGHVGLGAQVDAAVFYSEESPANALMGAARLIHFCKRTVNIDIPLNETIVRRRFVFGLGNVADLLVAHTSKWGKHGAEVGYNATFGFGAKLDPDTPLITDNLNFILSGFYANYKYQFLIHEKYPSVFAAGASYTLDHVKGPVNLKYSVTLWGSWGFAF